MFLQIGDERWLCHLCSCESKCVGLINSTFDVEFKTVEEICDEFFPKQSNNDTVKETIRETKCDLEVKIHQENHRPADKKTKCEAKLSVLQKEKINNETLSSPEESVAEAWWNEAIYGGNTSDEKEWQPPKRKKRQRKNDVSECSDTERLKKNRVGNGGKKWKVIWNGKIRIRKSPSIDGQVVGYYPQGKLLKVFEQKGDWIRHKRGWSLVKDSNDVLITRLKRRPKSKPVVGFTQGNPLLNKKKATTKKGYHPCPHCSRVFTTCMGLGGHMRVHNSEKAKRGEKPLGTKWPKKQASLRKREEFNIFNIADRIQSLSEKSVLGDDSTKKSRIKRGKYPCPHCPRVFSTPNGLGGHMRVHNSQKSNKGEVPLGTKWPPKKGVGKRGRRRLSGKLNKIKDIHPCAYCGKLFSNRRALGGHIRTHRNQGDHLENIMPSASSND